MIKRAEITVRGLVQGVFFREETKRTAEELGIVGWVKNEADGSVKIMAEGEEKNLQRLIEWCRGGTKWSSVKNVDVEWRTATGEFASFAIR